MLAILALALAVSTSAAAPVDKITMFRAQAIPFGPFDQVDVEVVPRPGFQFSARGAGDSVGETTMVQWAAGAGSAISPFADPKPQTLREGSTTSLAYVGRTDFRARLGGNAHGSVAARLHLAVCGNMCFPIDYIIDRPVDDLPIKRLWLSWPIMLLWLTGASLVTWSVLPRRIKFGCRS